jgi:hypothetical protein
MSVTVVTGYVPLPCTHRSRDEYESLGQSLLRACGRSVAFRQSLEDCWLYRPGVEPGGKDTPAYHVVQHEKSAWLAAAAAGSTAHTLVWIDYGVLHNSSITTDAVCGFVENIATNPPTRITTPSIGPYDHDDANVCWTFLGTVLVVPRRLAGWFHRRCVKARREPTTWEVNTWATVRHDHPDFFSLYTANHDETLVTWYRP